MVKKVVGNKNKVASQLLRVGLAIVFLYAAIFSLKNPNEWIGYVPTYLAKGLSVGAILKLVSIVQIVLAVWLISGKYLRYAAALAALMLAVIIVTNWSQLYITFRDIGLLFMALALVILES
jgi:uncharacterized membrane protein YphA (DoxX/SURF4 family)